MPILFITHNCFTIWHHVIRCHPVSMLLFCFLFCCQLASTLHLNLIVHSLIVSAHLLIVLVFADKLQYLWHSPHWITVPNPVLTQITSLSLSGLCVFEYNLFSFLFFCFSSLNVLGVKGFSLESQSFIQACTGCQMRSFGRIFFGLLWIHCYKLCNNKTKLVWSFTCERL